MQDMIQRSIHNGVDTRSETRAAVSATSLGKLRASDFVLLILAGGPVLLGGLVAWYWLIAAVMSGFGL